MVFSCNTMNLQTSFQLSSQVLPWMLLICPYVQKVPQHVVPKDCQESYKKLLSMNWLMLEIPVFFLEENYLCHQQVDYFLPVKIRKIKQLFISHLLLINSW